MKFQQIRRNLNNFFSVMYPSKSMYFFPKHCCQQVIPIWTKPTQRLGSYTRLSSIHHRSDSLNQNIALTVLPLQDVQIADFKTTTSKNYSNCSVSMTPNHPNSKFWKQAKKVQILGSTNEIIHTFQVFPNRYFVFKQVSK